MRNNRTLTRSQVPGTIDGREVTFEEVTESVELIPLHTNLPVGDPRWEHTDPQGHEHKPSLRKDAIGQKVVSGYPTLRPVETEPAWCELCLDTHTLFSHYECELCEAVVSPDTWLAPTPEYIEGPSSVLFKLVTDDYWLGTGPDIERELAYGGHRYKVRRGSITMESNNGNVRCEIEFYPTAKID